MKKVLTEEELKQVSGGGKNTPGDNQDIWQKPTVKKQILYR